MAVIKESELAKVKEVQSKYQTIALALGRIKIQKLDLDEQESGLVTEFEACKLQEKEIISELNTAYGKGVLNIDTGEFVTS